MVTVSYMTGRIWIQILFALHTWPDDERHKQIQQLEPGTEITCTGGHRNGWPFVHLSAKIPLWTQFHWVLLGISEEISSWKLWLHLYDVAREYARSTYISFSWNYSEMGASDETMDGGLWGWLGGQKMLKLWSKSLVLNAIHLTEGFLKPLQQPWTLKLPF